MPNVVPFAIQLHSLCWLEGQDEANDLCAHGRLDVVVGDDALCTPASGEWTLTAAALHLMRTTEVDYAIGDFGGQLIPCCGFSMIPDENQRRVFAFGCATGIDWSVRHDRMLGVVVLTTNSGREHLVDAAVYRKEIAQLADAVERFYTSSAPKKTRDTAEERAGFLLLWEEWARLRARAA